MQKLILTKEMSKATKNILILVLIGLLVIGIAVAVYSHFKTEPMEANVSKENILDNANKGLENFINDIFDENDIGNSEQSVENKDNNQATSTTAPGVQNDVKEDNEIESQITPGEKKALELVKAEWKKVWGNLNGVSFNNESIQSDGKYVVSVNDSKTTRVIRRYVVDTITGVVEEK